MSTSSHSATRSLEPLIAMAFSLTVPFSALGRTVLSESH